MRTSGLSVQPGSLPGRVTGAPVPEVDVPPFDGRSTFVGTCDDSPAFSGINEPPIRWKTLYPPTHTPATSTRIMTFPAGVNRGILPILHSRRLLHPRGC